MPAHQSPSHLGLLPLSSSSSSCSASEGRIRGISQADPHSLDHHEIGLSQRIDREGFALKRFDGFDWTRHSNC